MKENQKSFSKSQKIKNPKFHGYQKETNILKFYKLVSRELRETYTEILVHYVYILIDNDMQPVYK